MTAQEESHKRASLSSMRTMLFCVLTLTGSAQVFDTVWQQFQKLSSPTKSTALTMEDFDMAGRSEFSSPQVCCGPANPLSVYRASSVAEHRTGTCAGRGNC